MNLEKITLQVTDLAKTVGSYIKGQLSSLSNADIQHKGVHDLVTFVDRESEKKIISELKKILPEAGFIAEENQLVKPSEQYNWIIDPLDGTTNFIHGVPVFSVSIALADKSDLLSGVVYEIPYDECFYAWKNGNSFLNGNRIKVSQTSVFDEALMATGFPYSDYSLLEPYMGLLEEMIKSTRGIRRLGSAAVDLAYIACGRFDVFFEYGLNPWDVAAGSLIVVETGGSVTDFSNTGDFLFGRQIVASNAILHNKFLKQLQSHFKVLPG